MIGIILHQQYGRMREILDSFKNNEIYFVAETHDGRVLGHYFDFDIFKILCEKLNVVVEPNIETVMFVSQCHHDRAKLLYRRKGSLDWIIFGEYMGDRRIHFEKRL